MNGIVTSAAWESLLPAFSGIGCLGATTPFATGKEEKHFHMHLVPRFAKDQKLLKFLSAKKIQPSYRVQLDQYAIQIKRNLELLD